MTEDEMVGWHHQLNGHEFEQAPGAGNRQGRLLGPWDFPGKSTGVRCHCLLRQKKNKFMQIKFYK